MFKVTAADLDTALAGILDLRDTPGTSNIDPNAHGSGFDRVSAFQDGFDNGPGKCKDYRDDEPMVLELVALRRILCTPPNRQGHANAAVLVAAELCGIDTVFKVGGAQAIAALAYGSGSVPKVDKIFGPGNAWVTAAKQQVSADPDGAAVDLPAGPSEVLVIADESARPGRHRV